MRAFILLIVFFSAHASAELVVRDAWSRATPPGMPMGAVFLSLHNTGAEPLEIRKVQTPLARGAEIHESVEVDGMMRMREVTPFILQPGQTRQLKPGGEHIMLMGLSEALESGSQFEVSLTDQAGQVTTVKVLVGGFGQMSYPGGSLD